MREMEQLWQVRTAGKVESSPVVVDGTAYFGSHDGRVFAVDSATGRVRWAYQTPGRINASASVFGGQVCVYCTAQTKALADFVDRFAALDTKVVAVFPGPASGMEAFREAYRRTYGRGEKPPFELLYDADLALTRALHIEDNIAVPTSLLLDRQGIVRWSHVAKDHADRPSAKQILGRIREMEKQAR